MTQLLKNKKVESTLIYLNELLLLFYLLIVTLLFGYYVFFQESYGILVFSYILQEHSCEELICF